MLIRNLKNIADRKEILMTTIDLQQGDCLKLMKQIPDGGGGSRRYRPAL